MPIELQTLWTGGLIFVRTGAIFIVLPFLGDALIFPQLKAILALSLSWVIYPLIPPSDYLSIDNLDAITMFLTVLKEAILGLAIGFGGKMTFEGFTMGSGFVGYQMGFGTANIFLPEEGAESNAFTALHRIIVLLIFLGLGLHGIFFKIIVESFEILPVGFQDWDLRNSGDGLLHMLGAIFKIAMQLSAPILVSLFFALAALGLISRALPQLNIFSASFSVNFFLGLVTYVILLPLLPEWIKNEFIRNGEELLKILGKLNG